VTFLHNELFFAAAQKKYVYIYDKRGLEVHCLREHVEPATLEFLPHHFLLASVGEPGACVAVCCQEGPESCQLGPTYYVWSSSVQPAKGWQLLQHCWNHDAPLVVLSHCRACKPTVPAR
jgi:hypothetical protein